MEWSIAKEDPLTVGQVRERRIFCLLPHYGTDGKMHWLEKATIREKLALQYMSGVHYGKWMEEERPRQELIVPPPPPPPRKG